MHLIMQEEIQKGNVEKMKYLLNKHGLSLDSDWKDYHLLKLALRYKQKEIVKLLLQYGARVNKVFYEFMFECTPLHLAVSLSCLEIIEILLMKGASLFIQNNNQETPLILAALMGKYAIVDRMLSVISTKEFVRCNGEEFSHFHIACMRNRVDIVKKFLQDGQNQQLNINDKIDFDSCYWPGYTALHFAVEFQCLETVELLVNCGADITAKNHRQLTPLHLAFRNGNESIIDVILSVHSYINKNPENFDKISHFHIACTRNNPKIVSDFLRWGVNIDLKTSEEAMNWSSRSPLNFAIEYECIDVIKLLLEYKPTINQDALKQAHHASNASIYSLIYSNVKIRQGSSSQTNLNLPNHNAVSNSNMTSVRQLLNNDSSHKDFNSPNWIGLSPLHLAVQERSLENVQLLLEYGVNFTVKDLRGKSALHLAFESDKYDIADLILSKHEKQKENPIDNAGLSHFHIACARNNLNIVKNFLQNGVNVDSCVNIESVFWPSYTGMHFACHFLCTDVVKILLDHGADITLKNGLDLTPLEVIFEKTWFLKWRTKDGFLEIIELILSATEADSNNCFADNGFSLFHLACAT